MDADDLVPLVFLHVEDHPLAQDAVGGHDDIELAVVIEGAFHEALGELHVGDIADHARAVAAAGLVSLDDTVDAAGVGAHASLNIGAGIGDDDHGALFGERAANPRPHPPGPAGNDGDFPLEMLSHGPESTEGGVGGQGDGEWGWSLRRFQSGSRPAGWQSLTTPEAGGRTTVRSAGGPHRLHSVVCSR